MYVNEKNIAILLAAYNAEKFLAEQVDSVVAQTNRDWTLYIRNDGSTDNTAKIISSYSEKYSNIIEIDKDGKNLGCRNNFFRLLEIVDSNYYMFCDADDVWFNNKIELSINRMNELSLVYSNKPLLVHTDTAIYDANLNLMASSYWKTANINPDKFLTFNLICICCCIGGSTMLFNKNVKNIMFPLVKNEFMYDYWIAINTVRHGIISTIHTPTTKYRQHDNNVCGVTLGESNSILNKLKNPISVLRICKRESNRLKTIGYGSFGKYLFYKLMVIVKIRFMKY